MIRVSIPCYQKVESNGDSYTAYKIEVFQNGGCHTLYKRYSEFEEMHKQVKKVMSTPEFPPKKVLKWQPKVLEQRRVILEQYLQIPNGSTTFWTIIIPIVLESDSIPRSFFKFLDVQLARTGSFDSLDVGLAEPTVTHQPMVGFTKEAFLQENHRSILPDIVALGIYDGLYNRRHCDDLIGMAR